MTKTIYSREYEKITKKLIKAREEVNMTQSVVAKKLKHTQSYVSKIESGQVIIDVVQLKKLAAIYGRKVEDFI